MSSPNRVAQMPPSACVPMDEHTRTVRCLWTNIHVQSNTCGQTNTYSQVLLKILGRTCVQELQVLSGQALHSAGVRGWGWGGGGLGGVGAQTLLPMVWGTSANSSCQICCILDVAGLGSPELRCERARCLGQCLTTVVTVGLHTTRRVLSLKL